MGAVKARCGHLGALKLWPTFVFVKVIESGVG